LNTISSYGIHIQAIGCLHSDIQFLIRVGDNKEKIKNQKTTKREAVFCRECSDLDVDRILRRLWAYLSRYSSEPKIISHYQPYHVAKTFYFLVNYLVIGL
jgi:hypothetical protein